MSTRFNPQYLDYRRLFPLPYPPDSLSYNRALQPFNAVSIPLHTFAYQEGVNDPRKARENTDNPKNLP